LRAHGLTGFLFLLLVSLADAPEASLTAIARTLGVARRSD